MPAHEIARVDAEAHGRCYAQLADARILIGRWWYRSGGVAYRVVVPARGSGART